MASKSISFNHYSDGGTRTFTLSVEEINPSIENNTSDIRWTITISSGSTYKYDTGVKAVINGTTVYDATQVWSSLVFPAADGSVSGTLTGVKHNDDGTKTISLYIDGYSYAYARSSASGELVLDTIARASNPSCITKPQTTENLGDVGSKITIYTNRVSTIFKHTIKYKFYNLSETIATNVEDSYEWTIPTKLANQIPNATSGRGTITVETYNSGVLIGSKDITFTTSVPSSYKPSISSASISDGNTTITSKSFGVFLYGKSFPVLSVSASGSSGSTISSYILTLNGSQYPYSSLNDLNNYIKNIKLPVGNSIAYSVTVKDSRGRTSDAKSGTIKVVAYLDPYIDTLSVVRCKEDGTQDDDGTYLAFQFKGSISNVESKNKCTVKLGYRVKGEASFTYTTYINESTSTLSADYTGANKKVLGGGNISTGSTYEAIAYISDSLSVTTKQATDISTGYDLIHFNKSGKSIAFGKKSEANATETKMEINFDAIILKSLTVNGDFGLKNALKFSEAPAGILANNVKYIRFQNPELILSGNNGSVILRPKGDTNSNGQAYLDTNGNFFVNGVNIKLIPYPVGAIFISRYSQSPGNIFGGTWVQIKERFPYATNNTETTTSGHNLLNTSNDSTITGNTTNSNSHSHNYGSLYAQVNCTSGRFSLRGRSVGGWQATDGTWTSGFTSGQWNDWGANVYGDTGSNSHNHSIPYFVVYVWQRTA